MRAFDPTSEVERPKHAYHDNLYHYNIGIANGNGQYEVHIKADNPELINVKTLETIIKENGDDGKRITYLKSDIEGTEIACLNQWLKSGIMDLVDQLGIEMHTGTLNVNKGYIKMIFKRMKSFVKSLLAHHNLALTSYNPNMLLEKTQDSQRKYYTHHDLLFVRRK